MTKHSSYRLKPETLVLLARLAEHNGLSKTAMLEWMIRQQARAAKLDKAKRWKR